jgi:exopolysaccharide production protein ExoY
MANGISALATRRHEQPVSSLSWRATPVSTSAAERPPENHSPREPRENAPDRENPPNIVWLTGREMPVGGRLKRCFDITGALAAILLLLPLFCVIALAIKLSDRGPVVYRHRRVGLNGTAFDCLKFRSMVTNADEVLARHLAANSEAAREWEENHKLKQDPRVTALGLSMRKTSLDELPQLLNIVKGEMSFVGPRPIVTKEVPKYGAWISHYLSTRPGLTGPWQVNGRNDVDYVTRVALDREYVEGWSFWRDLAIIARTVRVVIVARGSY